MDAVLVVRLEFENSHTPVNISDPVTWEYNEYLTDKVTIEHRDFPISGSGRTAVDAISEYLKSRARLAKKEDG